MNAPRAFSKNDGSRIQGEHIMEQKIKDILSQMTLEDKISLCNGADFWHSKAEDEP